MHALQYAKCYSPVRHIVTLCCLKQLLRSIARIKSNPDRYLAGITRPGFGNCTKIDHLLPTCLLRAIEPRQMFILPGHFDVKEVKLGYTWGYMVLEQNNRGFKEGIDNI